MIQVHVYEKMVITVKFRISDDDDDDDGVTVGLKYHVSYSCTTTFNPFVKLGLKILRAIRQLVP